jgi:hypothetical protein
MARRPGTLGHRALLAGLLGLVWLGTLFGVPTASASRIGGPPRWPTLGPAPKPGTRPVVLGVGGRPRLEIVGYDSVQGPCVYADEVRALSYFGIECNSGFGTPSTGPIFISSAGSGEFGRSRHRFSNLTGFLSPDVAMVRVQYRFDRAARSGNAVVGHVKGRLVDQLGMSAPFGLFAFAVNHCVTSEVTLIAFDSQGAELGRTSTTGGPLPIGPICRPMH